MIKDIEKFKKAIELVLESEDGLSLESEGNIFIRTAEGDEFLGPSDQPYSVYC